MVDLHGAGKHQAVDLRAQAANVGREFERQHGNGAVGEIDAGAAQAGFLIERRVGALRIARRRRCELAVRSCRFRVADVDGVVEIARGFAVDGDDGKLAVVAAMTRSSASGISDAMAALLRSLRAGSGEAVKLADHDLDVDAEIVFFAENFDDAAARILRGAGPVGDFYIDDYAFQILPVGVDARLRLR
jgi:hypothetical protein